MDVELADALETILGRRYSCRAFLAKPIPREVLERVFDLARLTPSWCNTQPWNVVVCEGAATQRFAAALTERVLRGPGISDLPMPPSYEGVYRERRREAGWALYGAVGVAKGDRTASERQTMRNFDFFGAPVVAVVTAPRSLGVYAAVDCGLYVQSLLLAATALGVSSIAQASIANYSDFVREYLRIPEDRMVVCGVALGYEDPDDPANSFRTNRVPQDSSVEWMTFADEEG